MLKFSENRVILTASSIWDCAYIHAHMQKHKNLQMANTIYLFIYIKIE
jgi:hypothetical protein